MDWEYGPGRSPQSLPTDHPSARTSEIYLYLVHHCPIFRRDFERDLGDTLYRQLDDEITAGRLTVEEVETLRRDHDGAFSIPLAQRYLGAGNASAVTAWMRSRASFWNYNWIDRSVRGARGRGTLRLFETLRDNGGHVEGAKLAADHLWHRLVGSRFHEGVRDELKLWYSVHDQKQRREIVREHRAKFDTPYHKEILFDWMDHIAITLRPFILLGNAEEAALADRVEKETGEARRKYLADLS